MYYGFLAGSKTALVDKLLFEMAPETLRGGVVVAVAFARHRSDQAGLLHIPSVVQRTVLPEFKWPSQHSLFGLGVGDRSRPLQVSSIRGSCVAAR